VRKLILRLVWLFVPTVAAVYGFPFAVLAISGELTALSSVVRRQMASDALILYGPSYSNPVKALKRSAILSRKPAVVVLGTSRVMQFRSRMFKTPGRFYNAGGAVATLWEFRPLLEAIPVGQEPEIFIIGLDQYLFNSNYAEFKTTTPPVELRWNDIVQSARWTVYDDYRDGKFTLAALFHRERGTERLGLNAVANNNGFRNDGSYYYGKFIANPRDPTNDDIDFKNTLDRIRRGAGRFEHGRHVSADAVDELAAFLKICRARGIHVAAFLPPFAHEVYVRMMSLGERYRYLRELPSILMPVFAGQGHTFFDFSDLQSVGASDVETIDGFHPSERAYVRMLLAMQRADATLRRHVAESRLLETKLVAPSPYVVFENGEF
jgi:hypothetical protein